MEQDSSVREGGGDRQVTVKGPMPGARGIYYINFWHVRQDLTDTDTDAQTLLSRTDSRHRTLCEPAHPPCFSLPSNARSSNGREFD